MESAGSQPILVSQSTREKIDPAWSHFSEIKSADGKKQFKCLHCGIIYRGGGINRMKHHLVGVKGNIVACKKVPHDVRFRMMENLKIITQKKQEEVEHQEIGEPYGDNMEEVDGVDLRSKSLSSTAHDKSIEKGKRKLDEMENFFAPRTKHGSQPSLRSVLASKEAVHRAYLAIARWFFDSCLPINALNELDPLDYTSIEEVDFWIVDEYTPELNYENLEPEIYQEDAIPITDVSNNRLLNDATESSDFGVTGEIPGHEDLEAFGNTYFEDTLLQESTFGDLS